MEPQLHIPSKNVDGNAIAQSPSIEASIEPQVKPQVKEEQEAYPHTPGVGAIANATDANDSDGKTKPSGSQSPTKHYALRSKDKKDSELRAKLNKSLLKQQQHNVVVQSRLKPVPFKQSDLWKKGPLESQLSLSYKLKVDDRLGAIGSHYTSDSEDESEDANASDNEQGHHPVIKFYQTEDHPLNRRGFKYKPCQPNPIFTSNLYSTTDLPPFKVRPSYFDRSSGIVFDSDMSCVSTPQGWRSVRSNIPLREGKHYMEFNIISANTAESKGHVRVGIARKEASLEAPVGFDGYGYGIRDVNGQKMTLSRPKEFMSHSEVTDVGFTSGDVIGFLVELPDLATHRQAVTHFVEQRKAQIKREQAAARQQNGEDDHADESSRKKRRTKKSTSSSAPQEVEDSKFNAYDNIVRDQIPIKYKSALYYEQFEYTPTKQMDHLLNPVTVFGERAILEEKNKLLHSSQNLPTIPGSKIVVYKNGVELGVMFDNLYTFLPVTFEDDRLDETVANSKQEQNPNYRNTDDGTLGYYPMLSVFSNGVVGLNSGPDFKYPVPQTDEASTVKPLSSRYDERVVEEWMWDLIDEVESRYLDSFDE